MRLLGIIIAVIAGLYLLIGLSGYVEAYEYPVTDTATLDVVRCELDLKPTVKGYSGTLGSTAVKEEDLEMDMLTFYCTIHAEFQGDIYSIAYRSTNPPKRGEKVRATLLDEYTLMLHLEGI